MRALARAIVVLAGLALGAPALAVQTVSVSPTLVAPAGSVTVTWSGIAQPSVTNYVRFCLPSLCAGTYHLPAATASGSMPVTLPSPGSMPPDAWTVRLTTSSGGVTNGNVLQVGRTIAGTVTVSGSPLAGVALSAPGGSCTSTNGSGQYSCLVPHGWTGNVTPSASGYLFTPGSRSYSSLANNPTGQNFAAATAYPVTGTVTLGGSPLAGVTLTPTGSAVCGATDGSGQYLCNVPAGWSGSITPSLTGHVFSPASRTYSAVLAAQTSQDYAATAIFQVSGTVTSGGSPLAGVAMGATNGVTCSSSNGSGQYSCTVPGGWTGSVTPSLTGYLFTPASTSYTTVGANQTAQNYAATPTLQVSGTATLNGLPLPNVALGTTGGGSCSSTNSLGQFSCIVPQGWTGNLTPSGTGYTFTPALRSYASLATNQTTQDFAAATNGSAEVMYFVHVDHLNTPRLVANAAGQAVWRWNQLEPFGNNPTDENPSSLGIFDFPLRFAGQRYDSEAGLHYNYYRDYDAGIGGYKESDPIGLGGGINTYVYVGGSPLMFKDPTGECPWCLIGAGVSAGLNIWSQLQQNGGNWGQIKIQQVGFAAASGLLGGGLGTATAGLRFGWNVLANTAGSGAIGGTLALANNALYQCDPKDIFASTWQNAAVGGLGAIAGNGVSAGWNALQQARASAAWSAMSVQQRNIAISNAVSGPYFAGGTPATVGTTLGNSVSTFISSWPTD